MSNIFLFTGENHYSIKERIKGLEKEFKKKFREDLNLSHIDAEEKKVRDIISECEAVPFLSKKRLIFVYNLLSASAKERKNTEKANKKQDSEAKIISFLDKIPETSSVVFVEAKTDKRSRIYKKINSVGRVYEFSYPSETQIGEWIKTKIVSEGGTIKDKNIFYIIEKLRKIRGKKEKGESYFIYDLWLFANEISKLISFAGGKEIEKKHIDLLVSPNLDVTVFNFIDALMKKNVFLSARFLQDLVSQGASLNFIFFMIIRQFRIMLIVKDLMDKGLLGQKAAKGLKLHPFVVKKISEAVSDIDLIYLKCFYSKLLLVEEKLKSGKIRVSAGDQSAFALELEKFVVSFCEEHQH